MAKLRKPPTDDKPSEQAISPARRRWDEAGMRRVVACVCEGMRNGSELLSILRSDPEHMPSPSAFYEWLQLFPDLSGQYARAREELADHLDAEIARLARDCTAENYNATRVAIDALKWRASKLHPKRYGDRIQTDVDAQVTVNTTILDATALHPDQRDVLRAVLQDRKLVKAP